LDHIYRIATAHFPFAGSSISAILDEIMAIIAAWNGDA
jgi:hypothetical protein